LSSFFIYVGQFVRLSNCTPFCGEEGVSHKYKWSWIGNDSYRYSIWPRGCGVDDSTFRSSEETLYLILCLCRHAK